MVSRGHLCSQLRADRPVVAVTHLEARNAGVSPCPDAARPILEDRDHPVAAGADKTAGAGGESELGFHFTFDTLRFQASAIVR